MWNNLLGAFLIVFSTIFLIVYIIRAIKSENIENKMVVLSLVVWIGTMWWILSQFN